jgi:hypothetical protein
MSAVVSANGSAVDRCAWRAADLAPEDGTFVLDDACLAEIRAAVASLADDPCPTETLDPEDFHLPACRGAMARVRAELDDGLGFALVDRLPVAELGPEAAVRAYWLLASMVARPVSQKLAGRMVYSVVDTGQEPGNGVRPDQTNIGQPFHTDNSYNLTPPPYVTLFCLETAMEGGISRLINLETVRRIMAARHPDLVGRLYRPYCYDRQREHEEGEDRVLWNPILGEREDGHLFARLSPFLIRAGYRVAGQSMDPEGEAALDAWEAITLDHGLYKEFLFEPGQIQFVDNRRLGHCRTAFTDWPDPERKRHLVRLWLRNEGSTHYHG